MKLLNKTILYFSLVSIPILIVTGIISYHLIINTVNDNINEHLWNGKLKAQEIIDHFDQPKEMYLDYDSLSKISPDNGNSSGFKISELVKMDPKENEQVKYRMLKAYYKRKGQNYQIIIIKPMMEEDDLVENLLTCLFISIAMIVGGLFTANWILSKRIWKPFYAIINQLNVYDVRKHENENFPVSKTKEFHQLALALNKMTDKIQEDYLAQKEFSENAAHEMQTPLAIIKTKIDLLIQSNNLKEEDCSRLFAIEMAVNRLSTLNKALILLAKIENRQFIDEKEIDLSETVEKALGTFSELAEGKKLNVAKNMRPGIKIKMDPSLCEVLVYNLVLNAMKYNMDHGMLNVNLSEGRLTIANSGSDQALDEEKIFERFVKHNASAESLGLGLAIARSIANNYGFRLNYDFSENLHIFKLNFSSELL